MTMRTTSGNDARGELGGAPAGRVAARPARPAERRGSVRPGGRRPATVLPPARPAVSGGRARHVPAGRPTRAVVLRRRIVAVVLAVVATLAVGLALGLAVSSPAEAAGAGRSTVTVVGPGESLQDVARRVTPGADEREVAARIRELNGLPGSGVSVGRPLLVPVG